jgi:hypothetical protein
MAEKEIQQMIKIPDGYKIIGYYGRSSKYVYLKKRGDKVATPFSLDDSTFNSLPSQLGLI